MKPKKTILIISCILFTAFILGAANIISLSGPDHSKPDEDILIGVLVTLNSLYDSQDEDIIQEYVQTQPQSLNPSIPKLDRSFKRLYGSVADETEDLEDVTDSDDKMLIKTKTVNFEDVDGICFFIQTTIKQNSMGRILDDKDEQGGIDVLYKSVSDDRVTERYTEIKSVEDIQTISVEGTIYALSTLERSSFFFNPIYLSSNGEVYAVAGESISSSGNDAGSQISFTIENTHNQTVQNTTKNSERKIKVSIAFMDEPLSTRVLEFDNNARLLLDISFTPSSVPKQFQTQSNTAYILVETNFASKGNTGTTRTLFQPKDESFSTFLCEKDGICIQRSHEIIWKK